MINRYLFAAFNMFLIVVNIATMPETDNGSLFNGLITIYHAIYFFPTTILMLLLGEGNRGLGVPSNILGIIMIISAIVNLIFYIYYPIWTNIYKNIFINS